MQGVLPGDAFIDGNAGVTTQALGVLAARDWLHGIVPWWNPYSGIGLPLAGEMQPAAFFLPFLFLLLLPAGVACLKVAMQAVAGCSTFALLRQMGLGRPAALAGGVVFELNGTFAWIAHAPMLPVAFLPLLLLGIERAAAAAEHGRSLGWRWITIAIAYALLAGFPEVAYLDGLLALAWSAWRGLGLPPAARLAFAGKVGLGGGLGMLLAAPLLTGFADFLLRATVAGHVDFGHRALVAPNLAMLLFPYVAGTVGNHTFWFTIGGTIGLPVAFLGSLALWRPRASGPRILLAAWLVVGLAAAADAPMIRSAVDAIPLVRQTMFANYAAPSWSMAASVLCGLALDDWRRLPLGRVRVLLAAGGALIVASMAVAASLPALEAVWHGDPTGRVLGAFSLMWGYLLTGGLGLLCLRPRSTWNGLALVAVLTLDSIATSTVPLLGGTRRPPLDMEAVGFLHDHLGLARFVAAGTILPNYGALFGLASVNTNYLPNDRAWADHVVAALDPTADPVNFAGSLAALQTRLDAYEALGVRYAVLPIGADLPGAERVFRSALTDIFLLPAPAPYFEAKGGPCSLSAETRTKVSASCKAEATLVRRELFMPGWRATSGQGSAPVARWKDLFQSIDLPAGTTRVAFDFRPPGVKWAELAMLLAALAFAASFRPRRRAP